MSRKREGLISTDYVTVLCTHPRRFYRLGMSVILSHRNESSGVNFNLSIEKSMYFHVFVIDFAFITK